MDYAGTILNAFGTYEWDAQLYGALSLGSRVSLAIRSRANRLLLAYHLRFFDKSLNTFFGKVNDALEGRIPPDPNAEPVTSERLKDAADNLEHLSRIIDNVHESLRRAGLTNDSLTAGYLRSIYKHREQLLDLSDWCELAAQPEQVDEIFKGAQQEKERGLSELTRAR